MDIGRNPSFYISLDGKIKRYQILSFSLSIILIERQPKKCVLSSQNISINCCQSFAIDVLYNSSTKKLHFTFLSLSLSVSVSRSLLCQFISRLESFPSNSFIVSRTDETSSAFSGNILGFSFFFAEGFNVMDFFSSLSLCESRPPTFSLCLLAYAKSLKLIHLSDYFNHISFLCIQSL